MPSNPQHLHQSPNQFCELDHIRLQVDETLSQKQAISWLQKNTPEYVDGENNETLSLPEIYKLLASCESKNQVPEYFRLTVFVLLAAFAVEGCGGDESMVINADESIIVNVKQPDKAAKEEMFKDLEQGKTQKKKEPEESELEEDQKTEKDKKVDIDNKKEEMTEEELRLAELAREEEIRKIKKEIKLSWLARQEADNISKAEILTQPKTFPYYESLRKTKGAAVALFSSRIYSNYRKALAKGKHYKSIIKVRNFDGTEWKVKNSCVGFLLTAFQKLPLTVASGDQSGSYISNYRWRGKKGPFKDFIPDISGNNTDKYYLSNSTSPETINEIVSEYLEIGEYAVAAFPNHVFLVIKDEHGVIQMVHSGADVLGDEVSKVNQLPLSLYAEYNNAVHGDSKYIFMPLSNIIDVSMSNNTKEISAYIKRARKKKRSKR